MNAPPLPSAQYLGSATFVIGVRRGLSTLANGPRLLFVSSAVVRAYDPFYGVDRAFVPNRVGVITIKMGNRPTPLRR